MGWFNHQLDNIVTFLGKLTAGNLKKVTKNGKGTSSEPNLLLEVLDSMLTFSGM